MSNFLFIVDKLAGYALKQQVGIIITMTVPNILLDANYFAEVGATLKAAKGDKNLFAEIVNAPFYDRRTAALLSMGLIVLVMVNKKTNMIDRVAITNNEFAYQAISISPKPFEAIKIPFDNKENYIPAAIKSRKPMITTDWYRVHTPDLTAEASRFNQAAAGVACSVIYPLIGARDGAALIFSFYEPLGTIGKEHHHFMEKYARLAAAELNR
jgi:hypothetical protein